MDTEGPRTGYNAAHVMAGTIVSVLASVAQKQRLPRLFVLCVRDPSSMDHLQVISCVIRTYT